MVRRARPIPRGQLGQQDTQCIHVGSFVDRATAFLLRSHVVGGPQDRTHHGLFTATKDPRDAKINQLGLSFIGNENVLRIDITMDNVERLSL